MGFLKTLLGPSKSESWKQFAEQAHADYMSGGLLAADRVVAKVDAWTVTLDTYAEPMGRASITYTRMRAAYVNHDNFRFVIHDKRLFDDVGKRLGMQDIEIGEPDFDNRFIIQATDVSKVRALLTDPVLRDLILREDSVYFEVKDDEGWFGDTYPDGVDELYFRTAGVVRDLTHLKEMVTLFAETLHQLCQIGSAHEGEAATIG